jgi:outer membrane protein
MKKCFTIILIALAVTSFAQDGGKIWTLKECVDHALANNLDVQRSTYGVENAEIDHGQAKWAMAPSLNASSSYGFNWGRSINPVTNQFTTREINSISPNASSSIILFNGLRIQNTIKQTSKSLDASQADLEKAKNDVILSVINLYITVVFNKELLENARFQLSSSQQQLDRTKRQVEAGALPKSNELNLDAQVATNELNVINRENALALSLLQLKQGLQIPASQDFDIEVPAIEVQDLLLESSREQIYDMARQSLPEVRSARFRVESSNYALKATKGNLYPRLSLNGSVNSNYSSANDEARFAQQGSIVTTGVPIGLVNVAGTNYTVTSDVTSPNFVQIAEGYGYRDQLQDNIFRSASVNLSIPIFNGFQTRANIRRQTIDRQLAEITLKQTENTLRQNVETAYNDAFAASKTYSSSSKQVQAREEAFRMTKQRFEIGAANFVEYQVAENDLFQAKSDLARAKYDFIFKKRLLDFYQGKPILD